VIRGRTLYVLVAVAATASFLVGCSHDDAGGPSNEQVVNDLKKQGAINTDPNAPGAQQPRDMLGNPISVGGSKGGPKLGKPVAPATETTPQNGPGTTGK